MCYRMMDRRFGAMKERSESAAGDKIENGALKADTPAASRQSEEKAYVSFMERFLRRMEDRQKEEETSS